MFDEVPEAEITAVGTNPKTAQSQRPTITTTSMASVQYVSSLTFIWHLTSKAIDGADILSQLEPCNVHAKDMMRSVHLPQNIISLQLGQVTRDHCTDVDFLSLGLSGCVAHVVKAPETLLWSLSFVALKLTQKGKHERQADISISILVVMEA